MKKYDHLVLGLPESAVLQLKNKHMVQFEEYAYASKDNYVVRACRINIPIRDKGYIFEIRPWIKMESYEFHKIKENDYGKGVSAGILLNDILEDVHCPIDELINVSIEYFPDDKPYDIPKITGSTNCLRLNEIIKKGLKEKELTDLLKNIDHSQ